MFYQPAPDKPAYAAVAPAHRIPPDPIAWLWPGRIPHAQLSLLVGDPGVGKSLLAADLAARISADRPWPDQPGDRTIVCPTDPFLSNSAPLAAPSGSFDPSVAPDQPAPPDVPSPDYPWQTNPFFATGPASADRPLHHGAAIVASPEDHPAQVLLPRLQAAGARLPRVAVLYGVSSEPNRDALVSPLLLPDNLPALRGAACSTMNARLLVLDPLHALLSPAAQCNPAVLARLLAELADYARSFNIAVLASIHLAKTGHGRALYNVRGSIALTAAARSVHLLSRDPDDPDRRVLAPLKTVYGLPPLPLAFRIVPGPRLEWESDPVLPPPETIDQAASIASALSEACDWLSHYLRKAPRPARQLLKAAARVGFSRMTLFRARRLLNIRSFKTKGGAWVWSPIPVERSSTSLPPEPPAETPFSRPRVPTSSPTHPPPRPQKAEEYQTGGQKP